MNGANKIDRVFTANGCGSNNGSKSVPCMTVDLFGDWREELILRTDDNSKLRVWCSTATTKARIATLMHDMQYRAQNCCQQSSYNQPPHVSYYLGSDAAVPGKPKVQFNNTPHKMDNPVVDEPVQTEPPQTQPQQTQPPQTQAPQPQQTEAQQVQPQPYQPVSGNGKPIMEYLDRGIYAVKNNLSVMDLNKLLEEYKELTLQ